MTTFKKKDFKSKVISQKHVNEFVNEFVNDDGGIISGGEKYNKGVDVKTGPVNMPGDDKGLALTTNKFAATAIQPVNWWWSLSYGQSVSAGSTGMANNLGESKLDDKLTTEQQAVKMVEDVLSKMSKSSDFVKKGKTSDVNRNQIPDIDELSDTNMIVAGKLGDMIDTINSVSMTGEDIGIVINYLISNVDTSQIPSDYKNIIRKQL